MRSEASLERRSAARRFVTVFLSLRGRLILLVCLVTVPAILFILFVAATERRAALDRMETEARHLGGLASREHAHELNGGRNLLRRLGGTLACAGHASPMPACHDYFPLLLSGFSQFANLGVADPGGEVVCSAAPLQAPATLKGNSAFERALRSGEVEAGTYAVGFVGRPVLHLAHALRDERGAPCAVTFVAVELGWLDRLAEQANLPADYSLIIADREGHVLARSGAGAPAEERSRPDPAVARAIERPRGAVLEIGDPATRRYFVATPMEGIPGVFVLAGLPHERVQATANRVFYRTLLGLALVALFAVGSSLFAAEISVLRVLRALTRAVRRFGAGDLSARPPLPAGHGELRELSLSFSGMADALSARQREAREARDRLRALSHRLQAVRDEEAGRIARELHDELGQILTGLKMELSRARRVCQLGDAQEALSQMSDRIDQAIDSVRRISSELRPPVLDRLGLAAAIDWLARDCEVKAGFPVLLDVHGLAEPIDPRVSTAVFRIVQEALTNVVRHADATEVSVDVTGDERALVVTIHDDGKGIDEAAIEGPEALGILGMRERVGLLGGSLVIHGERGAGTTILVEVPRRPPRAEEREQRA
jgi:signal transduction histidine kinase